MDGFRYNSGMNAYPPASVIRNGIFWNLFCRPGRTLRVADPWKNSRRGIIGGILYVLRAGGTWRMMPHDLPHWKTCYHYFRLWSKLGYWAKIHDAVRDRARMALGKRKAPTTAVIDSQSVRTASQPGPRGYDAAKKITGRKRHILVDTCGFLLALKVTPANVQDRDGARMLLAVL